MKFNRTEEWIAEHSIRIFLIVAVLIVAGAIAVIAMLERQGKTQHQVDVLKPQVTKVIRAASVCSLDVPRRSQESLECALRFRIALVNCRRYSRCRAAFLALATYPPPARNPAPSSTTVPSSEGGDAVQQPSHQGHQPPGPGSQPGHGTGEGGPGAGQGQGSPGNGAQGSQGGSSPSGVGVEVCTLERTCVGVEVGVDPKGLLP